MIKKLYDKCVTWAGYKYAKQILAIEAFIESSFFPIPPDVMIVPMVISKKEEFLKIALIATEKMTDSRFEKTVIVMLESDQNGAWGLTINKRLGTMPIALLVDPSLN